MRRVLFLTIVLSAILASSCAELQQISEEISNSVILTEEQIGDGLKEALTKGINEEVTKLTLEDGFYSNPMVKIELPSELETVENILQKVGLESLTEQGIRALNKTAEKAVKEATPLFIAAIKNLTFEESKAILLGSPSAATDYLKSKTENELYLKFQPVVEANFKKVGADQIWETTILRYNQIPLTKEVNPNLTDYVTSQALKGVYKMIEMEEIEIRDNINKRSSLLLKRVFALQD
jgi:RNA binding exosome subunit